MKNRKIIIGHFPPPPVEVGYKLDRWRYRWRDPDGIWHTRDTRSLWFVSVRDPA